MIIFVALFCAGRYFESGFSISRKIFGGSLHYFQIKLSECQIVFQYEWLLNGRPLMKAHRFVLTHDFGFIALNILYMYPEDSGTYTLIVKNAAGEAQSVADIDCAAKGSMVTCFCR